MVGILALNVANPPVDRAKALLEWLWHQAEDVLVLSELGAGPGSELLLAVCRSAGFSVHVTDRAALGVAVIGRGVVVRPDDVSLPSVLPGRVAAVVLDSEPSGIRPSVGRRRAGASRAANPAMLHVLGVYGAASDPVRYTNAAQRQRKRAWIADFDGWLPTWGSRAATPQVVVGDLNLVDPHHDSILKYVLPEETELLGALSGRHGLVDAFRLCHPESDEPSWVDHSGAGCRYDHAFVTPDLVARVLDCSLDAEPRQLQISDHSALRLHLS